MHTRRHFLRQAALLTTAAAVNPSALFKSKRATGVQLYTLRTELKDIPGTIAKVAQIGYQQVETFGYDAGKYLGMEPKAFAALFEQNKLTTPSGHYYLPEFLFKGNDDVWKRAVEDAQHLKHKYMVVPWLEPQYRKDADGYKKLAARLSKAAELTKDGGMTLAYHNHDFEFENLGGVTAWDILAKETDPSLVKFEMDLYWTVFAGKDPIEVMKAHKGRVVMWHVKDMAAGNKTFAEVGSGTIDFKKIFAVAKLSGMQYFFVEQDQCPGSPFDSIRKSYQYIQTNLI
ncbi:MAG: sugar phosphate isomerase/epimerase [Chitinophagales bacterium]|nr:sugar phosphate isomerase/epimerase [Chitinophagales bacterium]